MNDVFGFCSSKLILMSPWIVMDVDGLCIRMVLIAFCMFWGNCASGWHGRLYMFMIVCIGFVFSLFECIWSMIVAASGILMPSRYVMWMSGL